MSVDKQSVDFMIPKTMKCSFSSEMQWIIMLLFATLCNQVKNSISLNALSNINN